jgi:hypothetical protein
MIKKIHLPKISWESLRLFVASGLFLKLSLTWFLLQALYIAISTNTSVPADELGFHVPLIQLFAENSINPLLTGQDGYYFLGEVVRSPFMIYHYLLSFPYRIFSDSDVSILLLRSINIGIGVTSLLVVKRIAEQLGVSAFVRNLSIFMLSNTLMFVFLFASINYDNLFILVSLLTFSVILSLAKKVTATRVLHLLLLVAVGSLTKISYLPIGVFALGAVAYLVIKDVRANGYEVHFQALRSRYSAVLLAALLLVGGFGLLKYVPNLVEFQTPTPACDSVMTVEQCRENFIYARNTALQNGPVPDISIGGFEYVTTWISLMSNRTYGILGHKITKPTVLIASWSWILFYIGTIAFIRKVQFNNLGRNIVMIGVAVYIVALINQNYGGYVSKGIIDLAVQGRYLFAVLPIMLLICNQYIFELVRSTRIKFALTFITLAVFASAGLPSYMIATSEKWYTEPTKNFNTRINQNLKTLYEKF